MWFDTVKSIVQELDVPLNASSWSDEDLKDPKKLYEMTILLNAQREIAEKILDDQWETKWRQEQVIFNRLNRIIMRFHQTSVWMMLVLCFQLNKMLEEKLQPYIQNIEKGVLPQPILTGSPKNDQKVLPFFFLTSICVSCLISVSDLFWFMTESSST